MYLQASASFKSEEQTTRILFPINDKVFPMHLTSVQLVSTQFRLLDDLSIILSTTHKNNQLYNLMS